MKIRCRGHLLPLSRMHARHAAAPCRGAVRGGDCLRRPSLRGVPRGRKERERRRRSRLLGAGRLRRCRQGGTARLSGGGSRGKRARGPLGLLPGSRRDTIDTGLNAFDTGFNAFGRVSSRLVVNRIVPKHGQADRDDRDRLLLQSGPGGDVARHGGFRAGRGDERSSGLLGAGTFDDAGNAGLSGGQAEDLPGEELAVRSRFNPDLGLNAVHAGFEPASWCTASCRAETMVRPTATIAMVSCLRPDPAAAWPVMTCSPAPSESCSFVRFRVQF